MNNETKCTGVNFGFGTIETKEAIDEEKIKALVEEIDRETRKAGLPWWAGMFNPKITALVENKCSCAEEKREKEHEPSEMEKADAMRREADDMLLKAMRAMSRGMETIDELIGEKKELKLTPGEIALLADKEARIGSAMAQVRAYVGLGIPYGYASGCWCGTEETKAESR